MIKLVKFYFVLVWAFFIYKLMTVPMAVTPDYGFAWQDKIAHLFLFAVMAGVLYMFIITWFNNNKLIPLIFSVGIAIGYAVLIEYIQISIPGRYFSIADIAAGLIGSTIAAILLYKKPYVRSIRKKI